MKYDINDLHAIGNGEKTIDEIAKKYGVRKMNIIDALHRNKIHIKKNKPIHLISPYTDKIYENANELAKELDLTPRTIRRALNGERIQLLEELEIKLEEVKYGKEKDK